MKKAWNKLKNISLLEFAEKFGTKPKVEQWHKDAIQKHSSFIEEGGMLTFRKGRRK